MIIYFYDVKLKIDFSIFLVVAIGCLVNKNIFFLLLFSSLHEIGHLMALLIFGYKPSEVIISFYGIGLRHNADLSIIKEIIFLFAGVFVNLIFYIFGICKTINLALLFINILPVFPLDGGRILYLALEKVLFDKAYYICVIISAIIIILVAIYSLFFKQYNLILIDIYLMSFWIKEVFYDKKRS